MFKVGQIYSNQPVAQQQVRGLEIKIPADSLHRAPVSLLRRGRFRGLLLGGKAGLLHILGRGSRGLGVGSVLLGSGGGRGNHCVLVSILVVGVTGACLIYQTFYR